MICISCGFENREGELICQQCGILCAVQTPMRQQSVATNVLVKEATRPVTGTILMVSFVVDGRRYDYPTNKAKSILIGRGYSEQFSEGAVLDCTQLDGGDKGISRKHAIVKVEHHQVLLSDLGSTNGTFLNGRRIPPDVQYLISPDDTIRFGAMDVRIEIT